jgi:hypothetical protein
VKYNYIVIYNAQIINIIQFSQINLIGPAPIVVEICEFVEENSINQKITLDNLLKYIIEQKRFRIGYTPINSEYYGPYNKNYLSSEYFYKVEDVLFDRMALIKNKILADFPNIKKEEFDITFERISKFLNLKNENICLYIFKRNFYFSEKNQFFIEPIQFDYFVSLLLIGETKSWLITIWND